MQQIRALGPLCSSELQLQRAASALEAADLGSLMRSAAPKAAAKAKAKAEAKAPPGAQSEKQIHQTPDINVIHWIERRSALWKSEIAKVQFFNEGFTVLSETQGENVQVAKICKVLMVVAVQFSKHEFCGFFEASRSNLEHARPSS